ncbi:hypothetical protein VTN00DRAFT_4963 [Thermoascus crustaceus]|uniref:uncharacterized protein n=1 Tax=Thermoascus crustaceus TaxID=5088 RepID=UPI0037448F5E
MTAAEITRIAEDFGRFQLPARLFRRPLLGWMHGSWNLINGTVENAVTWATDCMAEDFWFTFNISSLHNTVRTWIYIAKFEPDYLQIYAERPPVKVSSLAGSTLLHESSLPRTFVTSSDNAGDDIQEYGQ